MPVRTEIADAAAVITLDRPGAMNSIDLELLGQLLAALDRAAQARGPAVVITGANGIFCAGADLDHVRDALAGDDPSPDLAPMVDGLHAVIRRIRSMPMPVIAAVEGPAVGAAIGIALAADLRVLGKGARLVPGYLRIGASPDGGVSWLLTRALGAERAVALLLRNRAMHSAEVLRLGLAEEVVDDGTALAAALQLAAEVGGAAPLALQYLRELTDKATVNTLSEHLDLERERIMELWRGRDFTEGVTAFLEKRRPSFTGS